MTVQKLQVSSKRPIIKLRRALDPGKKRAKNQEGLAGRQVPFGILKLRQPLLVDGPNFPGSGDYSRAMRRKRIAVNTTVGCSDGPKAKSSRAWFYFFSFLQIRDKENMVQ